MCLDSSSKRDPFPSTASQLIPARSAERTQRFTPAPATEAQSDPQESYALDDVAVVAEYLPLTSKVTMRSQQYSTMPRWFTGNLFRLLGHRRLESLRFNCIHP